MKSNQLGVVLDYLCRSMAGRGEGDRTDGQLLGSFIATGDEAAFEILVRRHGRLVLGVCRSVLGNEHDTEDAFQATFLVLVKKARAVRQRDSLRSWLYGVAHRVAVRAKAARARKVPSERQLAAMTLTDPATQTARQELSQLLHEEVIQLPEHYRLPVLLCCLEGKSRQEAAQELGWTEAVVKGRLERGRKRFHAQLARRGLTPMAALTVLELARSAAPASVPLPLVVSTTRAAAQLAAGATAAALISMPVASLTRGTLQSMFLTRLCWGAVAILMLLTVAAGIAFLTVWDWTAHAAATSLPAAKPRPAVQPHDNILGLVAPRNTDHPGAVMLHGGGRITEEMMARFVQLAGGPEARIVIIPSAFYGHSQYASNHQFTIAMQRRFGSWVRLASASLVKHVAFVGTDDPDAADDPAFVRPLASATGVWFCGGDQSRLNYRFVGHFPRRTQFQAALRDVLARGGVIGGTSAGMAALPEIMTLSQERPRAPGPFRVVAAHGLGLFDGAIVEQHFEARNGRLERFTGLLRDSDRLDRLAGRRGAGRRMLGLAVESSTALVLQADRLEVLGNGNVQVFIKSPELGHITWHTLSSGGQGHLQRDLQDKVMLVKDR